MTVDSLALFRRLKARSRNYLKSAMKQMGHPIHGANVYVCGEAYSNMQGWVQGALNSAELMLEENFNLRRPEWLPPSYDLGS